MKSKKRSLMKKSDLTLRALIVMAFAMFMNSYTMLANPEVITYYVSPAGNDSWSGESIDQPFATIQGAREAIRSIKSRGELTKPVTVYIRGGLYELTETIVFKLEDSGTRDFPIQYVAYNDEKPVISGGRKITGPWKKYKGEIQVCSIDEVKDGPWHFRQLFINGERQTRARIPNNGFLVIDETEEDLGRDAFKYKEKDFKKWKNLNDVEVVLYHYWNESRLLISELDEVKHIVTFTGNFGRRLGSGDDRNRYYIDNVLEGLDSEGEWYLDRHEGKLYYWPAEGVNLSELRAPVLNELVRLEGDLDHKNNVEFLHFRGLTFCDTDYDLPAKGIPTIKDPGDIWFPSAITFKGAEDCIFENNTIRNVGTYGLDLSGNAIQVTGNNIYDTGSGGIITRSYGKYRNVITYNHIHHCGSVFHSGVGINIDDGGGLIGNNLIHHTGHSGIYARHFATDYEQEHERRNQEQGLIIEYNEIFEVMQELNDGGGIFVRDDYIVIRNNLIHDSYPPPEGHGSSTWGIYLGCETRNCLVENNVVYRTQSGQQIWFQNRNNTIFNNIFIGGDSMQINYTNLDNAFHHKIRFLRNIIYYSGSGGYLFDINDESSLPMESDYNLIYNTTEKRLKINGIQGVESFGDWQDYGFDTHSIVADPLFVDPENDDYTLRPESPAFKLGFKPIDLSRVGLKGRK